MLPPKQNPSVKVGPSLSELTWAAVAATSDSTPSGVSVPISACQSKP